MKHLLITIIAIVTLVACGGADERKAAYLEKAMLSIEVGDLDKARIELKNVLQIDPKDAQAYFQLGKVYERQKEFRKAFANYSKAEELDPESLEYHAKIGRYYLILAGDIDKAIEKRDLILGKDNADINGLLLKAGILLKQKDTGSAKKIAQDIFSKHPEHIENAIFLAALFLREKAYEDSLKVLNACNKEHPDNLLLKNTLASTYLVAGKNEQAEIAYKAILKKNPEIFANHVKLAMFYQKIGNTDNAENVLRTASKEKSEDVNRKMVLVEFIQQTRGNKKAIDELKVLIAENPGIGKLRIALAKLYVAEKMLDEAEKIFRLAVSDFSDDSVGVQSRVYLAKLYMQKENVDAAVSIIDDAVKVSPNDTEVNFIKAKLQLINKDYEGAIISLRTVVKDDHENIEAYILLSAALIANGEEKQVSEILNRAYENNRTNVKGLLVLAKYHATKRNGIELEKIIDNVISIDANNYEALSYKSAILNERKMFSEAKSLAVRMIEFNPDMPNGYVQSIPHMLSEKKTGKAISLLEGAYKKVKEKVRILDLLVSLYISEKKFDAAINKVRSAINETGETAELLILMSRVQLSSEKVSDAKSSLLKASSIKPGWNEPYLILANVYMSNKQSKKAINILQKGLKEIEGDLKMSLDLAKIYTSLDDFNAAIDEYEKAYAKHDGNIIIANNLASLLSEHRDDEKSLKRAKELADILKKVGQPVVLDTVGWVYYKIGDYAEAVKVLKVVTEKAPTVAVFNYHLGMAMYKMGDKAAAKTYLTSALAKNDDFPGKADAKTHLKKLQ